MPSFSASSSGVGSRPISLSELLARAHDLVDYLDHVHGADDGRPRFRAGGLQPTFTGAAGRAHAQGMMWKDVSRTAILRSKSIKSARAAASYTYNTLQLPISKELMTEFILWRETFLAGWLVFRRFYLI